MNQIEQKELMDQLKIRCEDCTGLCCVALYCMKTDGFPADKEAGRPCIYLRADHRCEIHSELKQRKMKGCMGYDCFGAGQKATKICRDGGSWYENLARADLVFDVYHKVYQIHQMLWYLVEAASFVEDTSLMHILEERIDEAVKMTEAGPDEIRRLDVEAFRDKVNPVLKKVCGLQKKNQSEHDKNCLGKNFKKSNLDGQDFSMALMIAANLEGCSMKHTILLGADLRDANIKNTNLSTCRFLTQMQVNSAIGNSNTQLPEHLSRPEHWN